MAPRASDGGEQRGRRLAERAHDPLEAADEDVEGPAEITDLVAPALVDAGGQVAVAFGDVVQAGPQAAHGAEHDPEEQEGQQEQEAHDHHAHDDGQGLHHGLAVGDGAERAGGESVGTGLGLVEVLHQLVRHVGVLHGDQQRRLLHRAGLLRHPRPLGEPVVRGHVLLDAAEQGLVGRRCRRLGRGEVVAELLQTNDALGVGVLDQRGVGRGGRRDQHVHVVLVVVEVEVLHQGLHGALVGTGPLLELGDAVSGDARLSGHEGLAGGGQDREGAEGHRCLPEQVHAAVRLLVRLRSGSSAQRSPTLNADLTGAGTRTRTRTGAVRHPA